jgi:predicted GIY-YIG superfamily endonuclease
MSIIPPILNQDRDEKQLGMTKERLEVMDAIEFENTLQERVQELKLKLIESNNLRESDIIINQKDTLESIWAVCLI